MSELEEERYYSELYDHKPLKEEDSYYDNVDEFETKLIFALEKEGLDVEIPFIDVCDYYDLKTSIPQIITNLKNKLK